FKLKLIPKNHYYEDNVISPWPINIFSKFFLKSYLHFLLSPLGFLIFSFFSSLLVFFCFFFFFFIIVFLFTYFVYFYIFFFYFFFIFFFFFFFFFYFYIFIYSIIKSKFS